MEAIGKQRARSGPGRYQRESDEVSVKHRVIRSVPLKRVGFERCEAEG